jgi:delta24-sterol reductase
MSLPPAARFSRGAAFLARGGVSRAGRRFSRGAAFLARGGVSRAGQRGDKAKCLVYKRVMVKSFFFDLLTEYRQLVLVGFGLPAGTVFDAVLRLRNFVYERFIATPDRHEERVRDVQAQVRRWNTLPPADRKPMCTDRKTWMNLSTRFEPKSQWQRIRMSALRDILSVDLEKQTVRVEPFVSVGQVTRFLLDRGYMLAVTLEIEEATIGGLAMAVGMTTHSHKVGLLQETVVAYDLVLADGSFVRATAEEHRDLFLALPWSHGTLGLLVAIELRIIPVKPYIHLTYTPVRSQAEYCRRLHELSIAPDAPDFLEATVFSKEEAVIMQGEFADLDPKNPEQRAKVNRIGLWWKPWFYKHVETFLQKGEGDEYIPLQHYLMRHNRSIFWVVADMIPSGNHPLFRWLLGWMMPPKIAFLKFSTTPAVRRMTFTLQVFQDIVLPMSAMSRAIDKAHELFEMYPILLYPCRIYDHSRDPAGNPAADHAGDSAGDQAVDSARSQGQLRAPRPVDRVSGTNFGMFFDLGVYGVPKRIKEKKQFRTVHAMRAMEEFTCEVGGYPFLYADTFMTRQEFHRMFDLTLYEEVRRKYGALFAFPELYEKTKPEVDVFSVYEEEKAIPVAT